MSLSATLERLHRIKSRSRLLHGILRFVRALVLASVVISLWSLVSPEREFEQLALGILAFVVALVAGAGKDREHPIGLRDLALALEMKHARATASPLVVAEPDSAVSPEWQPLVDAEVKDLRRFEIVRNVALASTLVLPLALSFVTLPQTAPSFKTVLNEANNMVSRLSRGATLKILQGATTETPEKPYELSPSETLSLELLAQNLIEVRVTGGGFGKNAPTLELRRNKPADPFAGAGKGSETPAGSGARTAAGSGSEAPAGAGAEEPGKPEVFQSFQMSPVRDGERRNVATGEPDEPTAYSISFAVSEPVELFVPGISDTKALANLKVRQLPIPKVKLSVSSQLEDPWPDDQPLNLKIQVKAENSLQMVRLLIKSGSRVSKELVANVMAEDKHELTTDYRLVLEQFVESDLAQVEIIAEAIDRAVPTPLVGQSEPIKINTASAYGRYRATLQTLRELKTQVDEALTKQDEKLGSEAQELAKKAGDQSERSPFFDGLDRVQIHRFETKLAEMKVEPSAEKMLEVSSNLNEFLFEHEILDDRERDRDFFVAARGLSRLLEQDPKERPVALKTVTDRMNKFLDDRHDRWTKRVLRLPEAAKPATWADIAAKKPFHAAMDLVEKVDEAAKKSPKAKSDQLTALSKAVVDYRSWIEALESAEDKSRETEEKERQEGLASARDQMRELQKRQGEISADLDRAGERPGGELEGQWPATRMKQNANVRDTKRLEGQLRSLSPTANARIQAAVQAMEQTGESGSGGNYALAESNSDLAGRLLRQAESAASQSQQKRRSRGRRRRVTGDNYYGQSVVGGDIEIKREYQVDRRYREDILDQVNESNVDEDSRVLLERYLREVIR